MTNPTHQITEAEAVEIIAKRDGWTYGPAKGILAIDAVCYGGVPSYWQHKKLKELPDYLNSRDALQPVLETMAPEEWMNLHRRINEAFKITQRDKAVGIFWGARATKHLLTLPDRTLCLAVAAAIKEAGYEH